MRFLVIALLAVSAVSAFRICKPDEIRNQSDATCFCSKNGKAWKCTLVTGGNPRERRRTVCQPNDTKMEALSACYCLNDGSAWICNSVSFSPLRRRRRGAINKLN